MLEPLRHRNFRLLWIGQFLSFTGTMMQSAAILWHVSLLVDPSRKGLALGLVGLARFVPVACFSLVSGVIADAVDRRRMMMLTQASMGVIAGVLAALTFSGLSAAWPIYLLSFLGGIASSFDAPARQSLLPALVTVEELPSAISLNATMIQVASVAGPAVAGVLIANLAIGWVYAANAASFVFVLAALLAMRGVKERGAHERTEISLAAARTGLRFVFSSPLIRSSMLLDFFATFFSSAMALLPIFVQDILRVGPQAYGWLYAAPSIGAVAGGLLMVPLVGRIERRGLTLLWAVVAYGVATVVFGVSRTFWLTFLCLAMTGLTDTVSLVIRNIIRQLGTPDHLRGRMVGINMMFFMGGPQLGEFEAGLVANWLGAPFSVVSGGLGCLVATLLVAWTTPQLRAYRAGSGSEAPRRIFQTG